MATGQVIHAEERFGRALALKPPKLLVDTTKKNPTVDDARDAIRNPDYICFYSKISERAPFGPVERIFGGQPMYLHELPGRGSSLLLQLATPIDLWYGSKGWFTKLPVKWVWVYFQARGKAHAWTASSLEEARRVMKNPNLR